MSEVPPSTESRTQRQRDLRRRVLGARFWVYGGILLALVLFRVLPGLRARVLQANRHASENVLRVSGLDIAPTLIPKIAETYRRLYPKIQFTVLRGGTSQALEDLFNGRADVAFTSRPLTREEELIVHSIGDTALSFPVALGGIAVLASRELPVDSLGVADLKEILEGKSPRSLPLPGGPLHVYAPDPNLGLWTALSEQLGLPDSVGLRVTWLAGPGDVAQAVAADTRAIGLASTLALPPDLDRLGIRSLSVSADGGGGGSTPDEASIAEGQYPLYHYLYVSCRPDGGPTASGFVSFLSSGRGQRLMEREGFLPARVVPREIQLSQKPYVKAG